MTADLLAAIYADPDDDVPRHVLADHLSDRGDPRGEFISLQLARGRNEVRLARELELLQPHIADWLGSIAPVIDPRRSRFERGFLAHAAILPNTKKQLRRLAREPGWATVERFITGVPPQLLDHASFAALRSIGVNRGEFGRLARRGDSLASVRELKLSDRVPLGALERVFPSLRRLQLRYLPTSAELARLGTTSVRELEIERTVLYQDYATVDYFGLVDELVDQYSSFDRVDIAEIQLRRDADGMLRQLVA